MVQHMGLGLLQELELGPAKLPELLLKLVHLGIQILLVHQVVGIPVVLLVTIMELAWHGLYSKQIGKIRMKEKLPPKSFSCPERQVYN